MTEEKLFETEKYEGWGVLTKEHPATTPKYHIWIRMKREYPEMTEIEAKEIAENIKDFGKWKKFKELNKDLKE